MKKLLIATGVIALMTSAALADTYVESVGGAALNVVPNAMVRGAEVGNAMGEELGPVGAFLGAALGLVGGAAEGVLKTGAAVLGVES